MTGFVGQDSTASLEDPTQWVGNPEDYGEATKQKSGPEDDPRSDEFWISRARSTFEAGQTWFDISIRRRMEDAMRLFNSEHPRGSRYDGEAYKRRSRLFRPKTRTAIRKLEAAGTAAFFATGDALTCTPPNPRDRLQRRGADAQAELLNHRLQHDIPWYLTCIGALQDGAKQGVVISKQHWVFREVEEEWDENIVDIATGKPTGATQINRKKRIMSDHPDISLRPIENILFSPAADWRNPLQTSPYLIDQEPFYAGDVIQRAEEGSQGQYDVPWRRLAMGTIQSALKQNYDPIRQAREGNREDRYEDFHTAVEDHHIVWVHHNYQRINGQEWYWATLGTETMLTDPVPLEEVTPLTERPYVLGVCTIETHKPYPSSLVELARPLQEEVNDVTNLRLDNIRHIISPRYFIKRGTSVDVRSLLRNIAGGVTAMEDPKNDVNIRQIADTTSSSFQEQDRLAIEMDSLLGSFDQSSVASNHNINERVGNTQMVGESANQISEMTVRIFSETWVEPVLQQILELEQALESDAVVMAIVGQRMGMPGEQVFRMLELPVRVTVNVGFGATNPQRRLQKVAMAFETIAQINPQWALEADKGEVINEIMGAVGFKDAERFFPSIASDDQGNEDPRMKQVMEENRKLRQMLESDGQKHQATLQGKQIDVQGRIQMKQMDMEQSDREAMTKAELGHKIEQNKWRMKLLDNELSKEQNQFKRQELIQQRIALNHTMTMDERQFDMEERRMDMDQERSQEEDRAKAESGNPHPNQITDKNSGGAGKKPSTKSPDDAPSATGPRVASTPQLGDKDGAGVIARGRYGGMPFREG